MSTSEPWELNFDSAPFCNGSLHLGHVRTYALGDVRARWLRSQGIRVRYTTTFDAFGVPNETGAARAELPVDVYVDQQIERISRQLSALQLSYDDVSIKRYCDPEYYRWTQWLFLKMYEHGLVYDVVQPLPYCASCDDHLAHSQIENGCCWRCGGVVSSKSARQWYIRTSDYFDRLWDGIDGLSGWSDRARNILRSHMGKTTGESTTWTVNAYDQEFRMVTFVPATVEVQGSIHIRADHPLIEKWSEQATNHDRAQLSNAARRRTALESTEEPLFFLVDGQNEMAVFATPPREVPYSMDGVIGDGATDRPDMPGKHMERFTVNSKTSSPVNVFRVQDWLISRNRTWGTPLPLVECVSCGTSPVSLESLPVRLEVHGGKTTAICASCATEQPLLQRVLDCFFDDAWCFYGTTPGSPDGQNPFEAWQENPASSVHFHSGFDTYFYLHIFRFVGHFLSDINLTVDPEPIHFYHGHDLITANGRKMAKRLGNAPDLDKLLGEYGPDALRLAVLSNANPIKTVAWSEDRLIHGRKLLSTAQRLLDIEPGGTGLPKDFNDQLNRIDSFIAEYRIGSALDTLYAATRSFLSDTTGAASKRDRQSLLDFWCFFAPGVGRGVTRSVKGGLNTGVSSRT